MIVFQKNQFTGIYGDHNRLANDFVDYLKEIGKAEKQGCSTVIRNLDRDNLRIEPSWKSLNYRNFECLLKEYYLLSEGYGYP